VSVRIRLRIDRLVLHSGAALDRERFQAGFRAEMIRLLTESGLPQGMQASWRGDQVAGASVPAQATSEEVGRACAQRVYGALG
jgi:hypothetical protein